LINDFKIHLGVYLGLKYDTLKTILNEMYGTSRGYPCRDDLPPVSELGSPWQNAFVESLNGKIRDELLSIEEFTTLLEAKIMAEDFRQYYNQHRPHSTLKY
jgi:transposase InsO family protein